MKKFIYKNNTIITFEKNETFENFDLTKISPSEQEFFLLKNKILTFSGSNNILIIREDINIFNTKILFINSNSLIFLCSERISN